jgi:hypothetical protein
MSSASATARTAISMQSTCSERGSGTNSREETSIPKNDMSKSLQAELLQMTRR